MNIDFDEMNYFIYRYLLEQSYEHSAFAFKNEANIHSQNGQFDNVPMGMLVHIMQKALQMLDVEIHMDSKGCMHQCSQPLSFLKPHSCASVNMINQLIPQKTLQAKSVEINGRKIRSLTDLPKPVLINAALSINAIYNSKREEMITETLLKNQIEQETLQKQKDVEMKKQEQTVLDGIASTRSLQTASYIIEALQLPVLKEGDIERLQKSIQIQQHAPDIDELNIMESKPKTRMINLYVEASNATVLKSMQLSQMSNLTCSCSGLCCQCKPEDRKPSNVPDTAQLCAFGTEAGQLFLNLVVNETVQRSKDLLFLQRQKQKIVQILPLLQQNRLLVLQNSGRLTIFRVNFNEKLTANLIFSGHPAGSFAAASMVISPSQSVVAIFGRVAHPLYFNLRTAKLIRHSQNDPFCRPVAADGFGMPQSVLLTDQAATVDNSCSSIMDAAFFTDQYICFIREDGLFQVDSFDKDGYEVWKRDFLSELSQIIVQNSRVYVTTTTQKLFEYDARFGEAVESVLEFVPLRCVSLKCGVACLAQSHVFLFDGTASGRPLMRNDWAVEEAVGIGGAQNQIVVYGGDKVVRMDALAEGAVEEKMARGVIGLSCGGEVVLLEGGVVAIPVEVRL